MKTVAKIFVFLCLIGGVTAIQDINITMDSGNVEMCIAIGNISNYICRGNETLTIDGTRDYDYYIIPMQMKAFTFFNLANDSAYLTEIVTSPFTLIIAVIGIMAPMMIGALIVIGIFGLTNKKGG